MRLAQFRRFWEARQRLSRLNFNLLRAAFGLRRAYAEERLNVRTLGSLANATLKQVVLAVVFASLLQFVDPILLPIYKYYGISIPDDGDYATWLATTAGIGGVFIALYYASVSTVAAAMYSTVPNNVRALLARERVGNTYMRFLAILTFVCVSLLGFRILGFPRVTLVIPLIVVATGIGIIGFVKLGQRTFDLFDRTSLAKTLFYELQQVVNSVKVGGHQWKDDSFQHHSYRLASGILDTLDAVFRIAKAEDVAKNDPLRELSAISLSFLGNYQQTKAIIPYTSKWYEKKFVHPDWYKTSDSTTSIVHQSGGALQPKIDLDRRWIEERLLSSALSNIETNIEADRFADVQSLLLSLDAYLKNLGATGDVLQGIQLVDTVARRIFAQITEGKPPSLTDENVELLGLSDSLGSLPITLMLSLLGALPQLDRKDIEAKLARVRWDVAGDIYSQGFALPATSQLEYLQDRLRFERKCEGAFVTPIWYQSELLILALTENARESIVALCERAIQFYSEWCETLEANKRPWLRAALISRKEEYLNKLKVHLKKFETAWSELEQSRKIEGLGWSTLDFNELQEELKAATSTLYSEMAETGAILSYSERSDDYPDYGGKFLHTCGEAIIDYACENDAKAVSELFSLYFLSSFKMFEKLRPTTTDVDWRAQSELKIALAPVLDAIEVSGYLILLSEFFENDELWKSAKDVWNIYLADGSSGEKANWLNAAIGLSGAPMEIPHRATIRTGWSSRVGSVVGGDTGFDRYRRESGEEESHKSEVVRVVRSGRSSFLDGTAIFGATFLHDLLNNDVGRPWKVDNFRKQLDRQRERT